MAKLKIHCLQHVPEEGLGCIDYWTQAKGHTVTYTKFFDNNYSLPVIDNFDWLIVLGGSMNVDETDKHPWLVPERTFIEQAIKKNKVVIGICLGAQLISQILGAKVYSMPEPELGWHSVKLTEYAQQHAAFNLFERSFYGFHWHNQMFDLPKHAQLLMSSELCSNQAYMYGKRTFAFQFHPEITQQNIIEFVKSLDAVSEVKINADAENQMLHISNQQQMMRKFLNKLYDIV
jgi:GMP synthase-like glutamine amidotransferase